jgi:hypothetical protein
MRDRSQKSASAAQHGLSAARDAVSYSLPEQNDTGLVIRGPPTGRGELLASDEEARALRALRYSLASDIVELIVLTGDATLLGTLRQAVGPARRVWHVPSPAQVSDLLIAGGVGILVIDVEALLEPPATFITEIKRQFPDLVIVVAGPQALLLGLSGLIGSRTVFRFLHKPVSPSRARLFAEAAVRCHGRMGRREPGAPRRARPPRRWVLIALGAAGLITAAVALMWRR